MPKKNSHKRSPRRKGNNRNSRSQKTLPLEVANARKAEAFSAGIQFPVIRDVPAMPMARQKVFTLTRNYDYYNLSTASVANNPVFGSVLFALSNLPNYTEFTALFDEYRILQARVHFIPLNVGTGGSFQPIYTVIDYDDSIAPASIDDLNQYSTLMVAQYGREFERVLTPKFAVAAYSGTFTSYSPMTGWVDVASPTVQHYGVKYALGASSVASLLVYGIRVGLTVQFRNTR